LVRELVCLDLDLDAAFVDRVARAWDDGDAVFPLDRRLPVPARNALLAVVRPTVICDASGDRRADGEPVETGDALVVATSGTTGTPKAAVLTMDAVEASARATSGRLGVGADDAWFACLPPAHVGGFSVVARALVTGTRLLTAARFSPEAYSAAAHDGATLVSLVSTALARVDASLYRTIVLGGSRPPADRPRNCVATYGMTETGSGVVYDGVPLEGVEIDVRDGIVHVRGPMLLRTYRGAPSPIDANGWFRTGDVGSFADGRLSVEGREGDMIVTGGEKVWPEQVESVLALSPEIADVCVAGVPDPEWGDAVHAWVVPSTATPPALDELRSLAKEHLPPWCAPRALHIVSEIPRTALGKPMRHALPGRA
jgi:O-succinylbenzoic acid--CoA ligase